MEKYLNAVVINHRIKEGTRVNYDKLSPKDKIKTSIRSAYQKTARYKLEKEKLEMKEYLDAYNLNKEIITYISELLSLKISDDKDTTTVYVFLPQEYSSVIPLLSNYLDWQIKTISPNVTELIQLPILLEFKRRVII